jgi:triosephosphate isomerase
VRRIFVAGNWKMNLNLAQTGEIVAQLKGVLAEQDGLDVGVCPPYPYLAQAAAAAGGSKILVGAQDVYFEKEGAFTGEVSGAMLRDVGCTFTIVGHSERRHVIGETDELIAKKVKAALDAGLRVILCVGELLEERKRGKTKEVVEGQTLKGLFGLSAAEMSKVVIAYEPVWAIGTGVNASPEDANEVHAFIRGLLARRFGQRLADDTTIQYGGSVKPDNALELMSQSHVDGALVGGASLKVDSFVGIIRRTVQAKHIGGADPSRGTRK